jgi:hypothetical protein
VSSCKDINAKHDRSFWQEIAKWGAILIQHASVAAVGRCSDHSSDHVFCELQYSITCTFHFSKKHSQSELGT